ncbi:MAG TPA: hypothetical protein VJI46_05945 [Candidatus Nanoarchaeia archaeon]|nr:hypothetical protein [Candidatus Nanoarchaeia archaeon]
MTIDSKFDPKEPIADFSDAALKERAVIIFEKHFYKYTQKAYLTTGYRPHILSSIREFSEDRRRGFVSDFFAGFPRGENLGDYANRIMGISWFKPVQEYDLADLLPLVGEIEDGFKIDRYPLVVAKDISSMYHERDGVRILVFDLLWTSARGKACYDTLRKMGEGANGTSTTRVGKALQNSIYELAYDSVYAAAHERVLGAVLVADLMKASTWGMVKAIPFAATANPLRVIKALKALAKGAKEEISKAVAPVEQTSRKVSAVTLEDISFGSYFGSSDSHQNPFENLIGLYKLGLWPAGVIDEKFVVWHPNVWKK